MENLRLKIRTTLDLLIDGLLDLQIEVMTKDSR